MAWISKLLRPDDLRTVSNLQILARSVVEGFCTGLHRSPHKGLSVEFAQHRVYVPGDEIRRLDWKIFGRSDRLYVREYEEETNLRATILLDASGSMAYANPKRGEQTKLHFAVRVAACLSYLMLQQRDSVGLVVSDERIRQHLPPRSTTRHLQILLEALAAVEPRGKTQLPAVLRDLAPRLRRRGLVIVISDCFGPVEELVAALAQLRHARHEIMVLQICDRDELEFPFDQPARFESLEDAADSRQIDPAQLRAAYLANLERFQTDLRSGCHRHHVERVTMVTDEPYAQALAHFLRLRGGRA